MVLTHDKVLEYIRIGPDVLERRYQQQMLTYMQWHVKVCSDTDEWRALREELYCANSMPGKGDGEILSGGGYHDPDRLLHVIDKTDRDLEEYGKSLYDLTERARESLQAVRRFRLIFSKVPEEWQDYLTRIYRNSEKWDVLVMEIGMAKSTFSAHRNQILDDICRIYNSTMTIREIARVDILLDISAKRETGNESIQGQINLMDLIEKGKVEE